MILCEKHSSQTQEVVVLLSGQTYKELTMEDRCICCGELIPEGRQVCPACEKKAEEPSSNAVETAANNFIKTEEKRWTLQ